MRKTVKKVIFQPVRLAKGVIRKLIYAILDKPLPPPNAEERELVEDLKNVFLGIPAIDSTELPDSEKTWAGHMNRLNDLVLGDDPREFLRWDVIGYTMFVHSPGYIAKELKYLRSRSDWLSRWHGAVQESHVGHPLPYWRYARSSGNLIHQAYHIAQFEEKTGTSIGDVETIFEFGGGYGRMCKLVHDMGFRGRYIIFDLPGFSALQQFYLNSNGLSTHSVETFDPSKPGIVCVSDYESLEELITNTTVGRSAALIATWSLSETPTVFRESILSLTSDFDAFLISSQSHYKEVDNIDFFERWRSTQSDIDWNTWRIAHLGNNFYLMGKRRAALAG
jgi:hypothetical protein